MTTTQHPGTGDTFIFILIGLFILIVLVFFFMPVVPIDHEKARQTQCMNNVRQLVVSIQLYQQDHNGKFPNQATIWRDLSSPPNTVICPIYGKNKGNGYGYNVNIAGKTLESKGMPEAQNLVVLADSKTPLHQLSVLTDIDFRHANKAVVGFADGHVALLPSGSIGPLQPKTLNTGGSKGNPSPQEK